MKNCIYRLVFFTNNPNLGMGTGDKVIMKFW